MTKLKYAFIAVSVLLVVLLTLSSGSNTSVSAAKPPTATPPGPTATPGPSGPTYITLGFDDGYADQYQVRALLAEHGMKATFYIISADVGVQDYMTWTQIADLYADGNEIGGHTMTHAHLGSLSGAALRQEVCGNRVDLFDHGFQPVSFAYPYGDYDTESRQAVIDCGYNTARMVWGAPESVPPGDAFLTRAYTSVRSSTSLSKLQGYVLETETCGHCWAQIILHHVCNRCDPYSISYSTLHAFIDWLQLRSVRGTYVVTAAEVIGGPVNPPVAP